MVHNICDVLRCQMAAKTRGWRNRPRPISLVILVFFCAASQYYQLRVAQRTQRRLPDQPWASIAWHLLLLSSSFCRPLLGNSPFSPVATLSTWLLGVRLTVSAYPLKARRSFGGGFDIGGILGLAIIPAPSLSVVSGDWDSVGIGGRCTPLAAALLASCPRGGVLVSLALTDVPSLSLFSLFAVGFGGGGGGVMMVAPGQGGPCRVIVTQWVSHVVSHCLK
jgi:hypothetical protein